MQFLLFLCYAFLDAVKAGDVSKVGIDIYMQEPIQAVCDFAKSKIKLLGSEFKA